MKLPTLTLALFSASICLPSLLSVAASSESPVPRNGWYKCAPSTLRREYSDEDATAGNDDYYMETGRSKKKKANVGVYASLTNEESRTAPTVLLGDDRQTTLPFLQNSFDYVSELEKVFQQPQHHSHHSRHQQNGRKSKGVYEVPVPPQYECAEFRVPMCYDGICDSNNTIDIFVKRVIPHALDADEQPKTLWVLQGGPGASSTAMEGLMESMYHELDGKVEIYTMDHRGTGRSNRLECQAAEADTVGSPGGTTIRLDEVPACIDDVLFQIDNQTAAFSVTSAAMDLKTVIEDYFSDYDNYIYGLSYGTYLVERLIHFSPDSIKGFIIDGIVSEAGMTVEERSTYSNWDHDVGVVGDRLLQFCLDDKFCKSKFPHVDDLSAFLRQLYVDLDEAADHEGTNACADVLASSGSRPSYLLRTTFGDYLMSDEWRGTIPAIIYRLARCSEDDVYAIQYFVDGIMMPYEPDDDLDTVLFSSDMLYNLIVFSEMWETPTPDKATLISWYEDSLMASDNYYSLPYYCVFTGSQDKACKELIHLPKSKPFKYERDEYWNMTAILPPQATALLMTGGLDPQTRKMYGNIEYDMLNSGKMWVNFDYASHCTTFTTPTKSGRSTCGVQILASFVRENGVVEKVDTSCIEDVIELAFKNSRYQAGELFNTDDLYENEASIGRKQIHRHL